MGVPVGNEPIDFVGLAKALLDRAESLMQQWLPNGHKSNGRWYVGDFDGSEGKSANVSLKTGTWIDNGRGADDKGGDLIGLYARIRGLSNAEAARELMRDQGWSRLPVQTPAKSKKSDVDWMPLHPVPDDAPHYKTQWSHYARGVPNGGHWEYRNTEGRLLGVVVRFNKSDGSKDVQPISFCQGSNGVRQWRYKAFTQPRPLYGLDRLTETSAEHRALVIVVEGEKKADALYEALGRTTPVLGWPGGCKTVHMANWSFLQDYRVLCWPDADDQVDKKTGLKYEREVQPGMAAMRKAQSILRQQGTPARLVNIGEPGDHPDGWDCGDAVTEGWTREQLLEFMRNLLPDPELPLGAAAVGGVSPPLPAAHAEDEGPPAPPPEPPHWRKRLIWRNEWSLRECVPNVIEILLNHPTWKGVIAFDDFAQRVVKRKAAPFDLAGGAQQSDEWTDVDDTRVAMWIAQHERFVPSSAMVAEAVNVVARCNTFHPVREYLEQLPPWDGTPRLDHWLVDLLHVKPGEYTQRVSRWYLIGMVMRVLQPGVKFDYCLVLEGKQGREKSTALRALTGDDWFSDIELDLSNKDSMSNIRGKWLHEFGEMGSIARAESSRQKSFLSRQVDEFRPSYGRREIRCPRQLVFAGTTNEWQWNKDPTGGRRFWPLEVPDVINVAGLRAIRDQLFAEAYACARAGERYWPTAAEQAELFDPEQLEREQPEAYVEILHKWMNDRNNLFDEFTMADAILSGLKVDAKGITRDIQTRVGFALAKLGCERVERRNEIPRFVYKRPPRNAASSQPKVAVAAYDAEGQGVPI